MCRFPDDADGNLLPLERLFRIYVELTLHRIAVPALGGADPTGRGLQTLDRAGDGHVIVAAVLTAELYRHLNDPAADPLGDEREILLADGVRHVDLVPGGELFQVDRICGGNVAPAELPAFIARRDTKIIIVMPRLAAVSVTAAAEDPERRARPEIIRHFAGVAFRDAVERAPARVGKAVEALPNGRTPHERQRTHHQERHHHDDRRFSFLHD